MDWHELGTPAFVFPTFLLWPLVLLMPARRPAGGCANCGYDLFGNVSGICPECGIAVAPASDAPSRADPNAARHWSARTLLVLIPGCALHLMFRQAFGQELAAYYADPAFGNNAPWAVGERHFIWAIGIAIWSCYLAVGLLTWGVLQSRLAGSGAWRLPLASWAITLAWWLFLTGTWMAWFID